MTVKELKEILNQAEDYQEVSICIETPNGYVCPDSCTIGLKSAKARGIDWHSHEVLLIPEFRLKMTDQALEEWRTGKID